MKTEIEFEEVATCRSCGSEEIGEKFSGDEGWTICDACGMIEGGYIYKYRCPSCEELCIEEKCNCKNI